MSDKEIVRLLTRIERSLRKIQQVVAPDPDLSVADVSRGPEVVELTESAPPLRPFLNGTRIEGGGGGRANEFPATTLCTTVAG